MQLLVLLFILHCILPAFSTSPTGYDVSTLISNSSAACFVEGGAKFVIPRGYKSSCAVDSVVCDSLLSAQAAGVKTRDVYLFPSPTCSKSPHDQMEEVYII